MTSLGTTTIPTPVDQPTTMPWFALIVLALMGFILLSAETMPAGLLPVIATDLGTSEGVIGQFISLWALGTVLVTIPAINLTRGMRRKPLILIAITGLILANTLTAISDGLVLSLASRFVAGAFCGIIWGMLAAYGRRISPPSRSGMSLAIVSIGAPMGFAFGTPLGTWLGTTFDWRWSFAALSVLALVTLVLIAAFVPDAPGQAKTSQLPLARVFTMPGVIVILAVIFVWMLAHNTIYTYIAPFLRATGTGLGADVILLIYGVASLAGLGITALLIDRHPRVLLHVSVAVFITAACVLLLGHSSSAAVVVGAILWGLTFGGAAPQLQAALTIAGKENSDVANSFLPVAFNLAIFAAGITGAALLSQTGPLDLAVLMAALGAVALGLTFYGRRTAFRGTGSAS